eukprot:CAMPEP_0172728588 /NCGR_PEP_ID=MMETSP1074-20121228/92326_1 /TAXON_ID=2916 /ORGANISM="Ceratium fusus, Strain PA161109" /LENGTH=99 /DNA_ID=CAMNT_0013555851 /DNA_START=57 /DNA_END=353 /DNA_ORIENTATION=-
MPLAFAALLLGGIATLANGNIHWEADLKRARTWKPRSSYRGQGTLASANLLLNRHLAAKTGIQLRDCEDFAVHELRDVLRTLLPLASDDLKRAYSQHDG